MATLTSPAILKQRVGTSRTYIRPVQRDLDLKPIEDMSDVVSAEIKGYMQLSQTLWVLQLEERCLTCGVLFPLDDLPSHVVRRGRCHK